MTVRSLSYVNADILENLEQCQVPVLSLHFTLWRVESEIFLGPSSDSKLDCSLCISFNLLAEKYLHGMLLE